VIVIVATVLGGNVVSETDKYVGWGLLVVSTLGLAVSHTDANVLDLTVVTVIVNYLVGLVLILAGLYTKTAAAPETGAPYPVTEESAA
jgi:hypothetical protein